MSQTAVVDVVVALGEPAIPLRHELWQSSVGSGHAQLGTRVDWRIHLAKAVKELGLHGIRMHGWLDDDMSVAPTATPPFHWYNVNLVADYLVSLGVRPVFELDYMPRSMAKCKGPCYYAFHNSGGYKGLLEPPAEYGQWYTLIRNLGQHLVKRYGLDEVSRWRFEVWNEPQPWVGGVSCAQNQSRISNPSHD